MKKWIHANKIVDNGQIQKGLLWSLDGHTLEVVSVSPDHKTCKVSEKWINEDTFEEMDEVDTYNIATDSKGQEYIYAPEYKEYANPEGQGDDYSWWARKYATGANNYPYTEVNASSNYDNMVNEDGETFRQYLDRTRWEGFDPSGLSDDEYYELEDEFYGDAMKAPMSKEDFDQWWFSLSSIDQEIVVDIMEDWDIFKVTEDYTDKIVEEFGKRKQQKEL